MTTDDHIAALEAALAAMDGVVGPWYEARELLRGVIRVGPDADAAYIAAANPVALRALLDEVKRLRKDAARYAWLRDAENTDGHDDWALYAMESLDEYIDDAMSDGGTKSANVLLSRHRRRSV